ncbi:MAG TPA: dienelactone hydrolase family protein [Xanthobacteraceae bacterium]|jgi:dienelactone hydrolase
MKNPWTVSILCAALASAFAVAPARAEIKTAWIDYKQGDTALRGYLAYDDAIKDKRPGVLLVHRRDGMSDLTLKNAEMVARLGYVVFAPDIFGVVPKKTEEEIEQSTLYNKDRPLMRARAEAGFEVLRHNPMVDPAKLAVVGYCFGGTVAVEFAETGAPILGTVTIHGSFRNFQHDAAKNIHGRMLILHGAEDPVAPLTEVNLLIQDLRDAKTPWQLELYSGTKHGFSTPKNADEERANTQSQAAMAGFFKEVFGS